MVFIFLAYFTLYNDARDKCSGLVHWENPEGSGEREVGGVIEMGNTCNSMAD